MADRALDQVNLFWHRPMIPAAKGGMDWHAYTGKGHSVCGKFCLVGFGKPDDARDRMPSRHHAKVCKTCERKRP